MTGLTRDADVRSLHISDQPLPPLSVLPWGYARTTRSDARAVPPLSELVLDSMARRPDLLVDLTGMAEHLAIGLLGRIMRAGRLDFRLACRFRESGHDSIREAIDALDLVAAVPTHNTVTRQR